MSRQPFTRSSMLAVLHRKKPTHRKPTMFELICIASAVALGLGFVAYQIYNAPRGYQKDDSFHFGEETK